MPLSTFLTNERTLYQNIMRAKESYTQKKYSHVDNLKWVVFNFDQWLHSHLSNTTEYH